MKTTVSMALIDLDQEAMRQLHAEQSPLAKTFNDVRGLGLGRFILTPQLIVVGDRSAGKSSVLEAISRVRFPIQNGACTQFATELVLQQSVERKVNAKIQGEDVDRGDPADFRKNTLPRIIDMAKQRMGVVDGPAGVSQEVVRVEISGPHVPQLTLVDLPGFSHGSADQETGAAYSLAKNYMQQENSIILAVISAENKLADQKVLEEAGKYDPSGARTIGIVTKPDKMEENSIDEQDYLRLARNEGPHKLRLGWHVLRNRDEQERAKTDRERDDVEERFFRSGIWSTISRRDRGIESLREKLGQVILEQAQQYVPALMAQVRDRLANYTAQLRELGEPRSMPDCENYLTGVSTQFQRLALDAIQGNYHGDFFGGLYSGSDTPYKGRKLRALVRDMNLAFHCVLASKGQRRIIRWHPQCEGHDALDTNIVSEHLQPWMSLYDTDTPEEITSNDMKRELEAMVTENQGAQLFGSPNDRVTVQLFRDQSQPWEKLAQQHVDLVAHFARSFVEMAILHASGSIRKVADSLVRTFVNPYFERKKIELRAKVAELLQNFKTGYDLQPLPITPSLSFIDMKHGLAPGRLQALRQLYRNIEASTTPHGDSDAYRIIQNMSDYYDYSLLKFADNVATLALENCLISDIPNILTPEKVRMMSDGTISTLVAESKQVTMERYVLSLRVQQLQRSLATCEEYRPRESAALPKSPRKEPALLPSAYDTAKPERTLYHSTPVTSQAAATTKAPSTDLLADEQKAKIKFSSLPVQLGATEVAGKPKIVAEGLNGGLSRGNDPVSSQLANSAPGAGLRSTLEPQLAQTSLPPIRKTIPSANQQVSAPEGLLQKTLPIPGATIGTAQQSHPASYNSNPFLTSTVATSGPTPAPLTAAPALLQVVPPPPGFSALYGGLAGGAKTPVPVQQISASGAYEARSYVEAFRNRLGASGYPGAVASSLGTAINPAPLSSPYGSGIKTGTTPAVLSNSPASTNKGGSIGQPLLYSVAPGSNAMSLLAAQQHAQLATASATANPASGATTQYTSLGSH